MTPRTVGVVHAVAAALPPLQEAFAAGLPEIRVLNLLDEALLLEAERLGTVTPGLVRRITSLVALHELAGAEVVLLSCTAYSTAIEQIQVQSDVPVLTIDAALIEAAVASGKRLGVLGTIAAGVDQQVELLQRAGGGELELETVIRPDAYAALKAGDGDRHDEILLAELVPLARRVDAVVLAQASIARIVKKAPSGLPAPVLSSPALAVARVKALLDARTPTLV